LTGMKIICMVNHFKDSIHKEPVFYMKPDTSLLRNNEPFYIPPFSNDIHYGIALVYRICKVGKNISLRFAHRYYDAIALGIDFTACDILKQCISQGLPWEMAKSYENSLAISPLIDKTNMDDIKNICFSLSINGESVQHGVSSNMIFTMEQMVVLVSQYMTLKTGDLICIGIDEGTDRVKKDDYLEAFMDDKKMLGFYIR